MQTYASKELVTRELGDVWGNVNDYGESAPTADELIAWV